MKFINTLFKLPAYFPDNTFNMSSWEEYIEDSYPKAKKLCLDDFNETIDAGYDYNEYFLPILNNALKNKEKQEHLLNSFIHITDNLDAKLISRFSKTVDCTILLYLGLGNGAGWVTRIENETVILLGIEKIIELGWYDSDSMNGLILHELGHVYQDQYGVLNRNADNEADEMLWQLFTEGIAMYFEQEILDDEDYYHQGKKWKKWCKENYKLIKKSFDDDLGKMNKQNQRYFGDWVDFMGQGDTGYYLGTQLVRFMLKDEDFDKLINYDITDLKEKYRKFVDE